MFRTNFIDITGRKFGRLLALKPIKRINDCHLLWLCKCDCGKKKLINGVSIRSGKAKSCGCLRDELARKRMKLRRKKMIGKKAPSYKHGLSDTKEYKKFHSKKYWLKKLYNLSIVDYNNLLQNQNNKCAICGINRNELKNDLAIDHDHKSGEIRGLLCCTCNRRLGHVDNKWYIKALKYLNKIKKVVGNG